MTDTLDHDLRDLASAVTFPPTPGLRSDVLDRLRRPERRGWTRVAWPRAVLMALLGLLLIAGAALALGVVPGLRLTLVPDLPVASVRADPLGTRLALGAPVDVSEVLHLAPSRLGPPQEAYVIGDDEIVSLVYTASDDLPELDRTDIGLLLQVIRGSVERASVEKLVTEVDATVTDVTVNGAPGYWISGPPHLLRYSGPDGEARAEATRLVGDVLVWQRGETLFRIESGLGIAETRRIAETVDR
jgi:hypothetical protein